MACCLLAISLASIILIPTWLYPPLNAQDLHGISSPQVRIQLQQAQSQLANNARSTVLQLIAGVVVVAGAIATWRQVHISREGQITERFTRAVDQLGNQNVDVRVGGIYALERIAKDSPPDPGTRQSRSCGLKQLKRPLRIAGVVAVGSGDVDVAVQAQKADGQTAQ